MRSGLTTTKVEQRLFESQFLELELFEPELFALEPLELYLYPIQITGMLINHSDDLVKFLGNT